MIASIFATSFRHNHFLITKNNEAIIFARMTFIKTSSENNDHVTKVYNEELAPVIRAQKGNIGCWLLEPTNVEDDVISLTEWTSSADAEAYEASGTYRSLVDKLKEYHTEKPILKTYNVAETTLSAAPVS